MEGLILAHEAPVARLATRFSVAPELVSALQRVRARMHADYSLLGTIYMFAYDRTGVSDKCYQCSEHGASVSFVSSQPRSQAEAVCHDKAERDIRIRSRHDCK